LVFPQISPYHLKGSSDEEAINRPGGEKREEEIREEEKRGREQRKKRIRHEPHDNNHTQPKTNLDKLEQQIATASDTLLGD